jgi:fructose-1-phosphate kinase PfkB-like protein
VPGWDSADFNPLRAALERWMRRGTLVADTYGPPLAWLAERPVALVKINRGEFDAFAAGLKPGARLATRLKEARGRFRALSWVVTDGGGPVSFVDAEGSAGTVTPPAIREVSPTGSGDVLLACILHARTRLGLPLGEALAFAAPFAAANAAHPGIAEFPWPPSGK